MEYVRQERLNRTMPNKKARSRFRSLDNLQEQLTGDGPNRGHNLDERIVDLRDSISVVREIAKSQHV
jgi:hypothetical protein